MRARHAETLTPSVWQPSPMPASLAALHEGGHIHLDVRDILAAGHEPFGDIMGAVASLGVGGVLVLRTPFEPMPLYGMLARRGFAHWTQRHAADDWTVWFWRDASDEARGARPAPPAAAATITLDVRGLEPPQPMVLVLDRLDTLPDHATLEVLHDRRPLFLYPQLDARGFVHVTEEPEVGLVRIRIRRRTGAG